jgi:hypothetical protein
MMAGVSIPARWQAADVAGGLRSPANFRRFNATMAVVHAAQGVAILLLSNAVTVPISTSFLRYNQDAGRLEPATRTVFDLQLAPLVAAFLFISAIAHAFVALPGVNAWYERCLGRGINYVRWWEYAASASVMIAVIAILTGMYDLPSLLVLFCLNATMLLFGLLMEVFNPPGRRVNWTPFWFGSIAGIVPWGVITLYLTSPGTGPGDPPGFVYAIFVSLFAWYALFAVNMWLQYRRVGPWRDYRFGEAAYIVLSLTAKSLLAWQTFAGALTAPV